MTQFSGLQKTNARMLKDHCFFATILMTTEQIATTDIPTAATDGHKLLYNPDWFATLKPDELIGVVAHEIGHIFADHSARSVGKDADVFNQACDHCINLMLLDCKMKLPEGGLHDERFKGLSEDQIYAILMREKEARRKSGGAGAEPKGDVMGRDVLPSPSGTAAEQAVASRKLKQRVASASNIARMAGQMTGELARMVGALLDTVVPWTEYLRDYMLRTAQDDESWVKRNRRHSRTILPGRHSERMGEIIFIPDTSGSMWGAGQDLDKICSEIAACAGMMNPERIRVIWADSSVKGEQVFEEGEFSYAALRPVGGGGTDMRTALSYAEQYEPEIVILCTDGFSPWPSQETEYNLIVLCTSQTPIPIGQVIRI